MNEFTEELNISVLDHKTLTGDIRDFLLDRIRAVRKPWIALNEQEQRDAINGAKSASENLVKKACRIIAAQGRNTIEATVEQITVKDGIKAVLKCHNNSNALHELGGATGEIVLIVTSGLSDFQGEQGQLKITAHQGDLLTNATAIKNDNVTPLQ